MPNVRSVFIPWLAADVRVYGLWDGAGYISPPAGWYLPSFDDSGWQTGTIVTPDPAHSFWSPGVDDDGVPYTGLVHGQEPFWASIDGAHTTEVLLVRFRFTPPSVICDENGVILTGSQGLFPTVAGHGGPRAVTFFFGDSTITGGSGGGDFFSLPFMNGTENPTAPLAVLSQLIPGENLFAIAIKMSIFNEYSGAGFTWDSTTFFAVAFRFYTPLSGRSYAQIIG